MFTDVNGLDADVTIALGKKDKATGKPYPKQIEGYYLGNRTVKNRKGDSLLHFFQTASGNVGVWGTTDLNRKLSSVEPGTMTRATSTGTKSTPNGDMYTYRVEQDLDNTIAVAAQSDVAPAVSYEQDEDSELNDETSEYEADLASVAQRQAEVQALFKKTAKTLKN